MSDSSLVSVEESVAVALRDRPLRLLRRLLSFRERLDRDLVLRRWRLRLSVSDSLVTDSESPCSLSDSLDEESEELDPDELSSVSSCFFLFLFCFFFFFFGVPDFESVCFLHTATLAAFPAGGAVEVTVSFTATSGAVGWAEPLAFSKECSASCLVSAVSAVGSAMVEVTSSPR